MAVHDAADELQARELAERYWATTPTPGPRGRITRAIKIAHAEQLHILQQVTLLLDTDPISAMTFIEQSRPAGGMRADDPPRKINALFPETREQMCDHPMGFPYSGEMPCTGPKRCPLCLTREEDA